MKKLILIGLFITSFVLLSGCIASFGPLMDEKILIYESEDKSIRLEIPYYTNFGLGRLYIEQDNVVTAYTIDMDMVQPYLTIYSNTLLKEVNHYSLLVSFGKINYFKSDYDVMYLTESRLAKNDPFIIYSEELELLLTGFNETLFRIYDQDIRPLNYFNNTWKSEDYGIYLINKDFENYFYHRVQGTFYEESIMIAFEDGMFTMTNNVDNSVILSGTYSFEGLNIILYPLSSYESYPNEIALIFGVDLDSKTELEWKKH